MILHYRCILVQLYFSPFQTKVVELLRLDSTSRDSEEARSSDTVNATYDAAPATEISSA